MKLELPGGDDLLCAKQLADRIHKHVSYIYAMKADGFPMPAGLSTPHAALAWLERHPNPRRRVRECSAS